LYYSIFLAPCPTKEYPLTIKFYDGLTNLYHLIFEDWDESIERQADGLQTIIKEEWGSSVSSILDVSCGIGTQSIGLAKAGFKVTGSDLSQKEVERAIKETQSRNLNIDYSVADMRHAYQHHQKEFDLLISCDNSIPHLLSEDEILIALKQFYRCVKNDGGLLITIRDYEKESREGIQFKPYGVRIEDKKRYIIFQTWEFKNSIYHIALYFVCDDGKGPVETKIFHSKYYPISIFKLVRLIKKSGFSDVKQKKNHFYQPVIVATKKVSG
jgi:SAM-dependent methyltransferase